MQPVKIYSVKYFSGFSLSSEEALFSGFVPYTDFTVAGFSYGAQRALEYAYHCESRIDRLVLLAPAFFQTEKASFIRVQLRYFESEKAAYVSLFLKNVTYPSKVSLSNYVDIGTKEDLEALLTYQWDKQKIEALQARGISIEVFLGGKDKIISSQHAQDFFTTTTNYILKDAGHLLRSEYD